MNPNVAGIITQKKSARSLPASLGTRPGLLVSVRNADEALVAHRGGADVIDIKEPEEGPLGAATPKIWREICESLPESSAVTAALGELQELSRSSLAQLPHKVIAVKAGPAGCSSAKVYFDQLETLRLPASKEVVGVAYADYHRAGSPSVSQIIQEAVERHWAWLLIDTFEKDGRGLLDWLDIGKLSEIARACISSGTHLVLAGSIRLDQVAMLQAVCPALLAVRGAVCDGGRSGKIDPLKVAELSAKLRDSGGC